MQLNLPTPRMARTQANPGMQTRPRVLYMPGAHSHQGVLGSPQLGGPPVPQQQIWRPPSGPRLGPGRCWRPALLPENPPGSGPPRLHWPALLPARERADVSPLPPNDQPSTARHRGMLADVGRQHAAADSTQALAMLACWPAQASSSPPMLGADQSQPRLQVT